MCVQKAKTGQAPQLFSEQGSSESWVFYGSEDIQHPLRFGLWPFAKVFLSSPLHPQANPISEARAWGWKTAGKQPHSHTWSFVSSVPIDIISSSSIVSEGGRQGLHHFPRVLLQKHYSAKEWLWFVTEKASQTVSFHLIFAGQWGKEHIFSSKSIQQICTAVS